MMMMMMILYDYKVELTGVGYRSQINADDNIVIQLHSCMLIFPLHKLGIEAHAHAHYTSLRCFALLSLLLMVLYMSERGRSVASSEWCSSSVARQRRLRSGS